MDRPKEMTLPARSPRLPEGPLPVDRYTPTRLRSALVACDMVGLVIAWLVALLTVEGDGLRGLATPERAVVGAVGVAAVELALRRQALYRSRTCSILANELRGLARSVLVGTVTALAVDAVLWPPASIGRAAVAGVLSVALLVVGRLAYEARLRWLRTRGIAIRPVVLIGAGDHAEQLLELLRGQPEFGYQLVGYLGESDRLAGSLAWLGTLDDPVDAVLRHGAGGVVIAASDVYEADLATMTRDLVGAGIHIQVSPGLLGAGEHRLDLTAVAHEPLLYVEPPGHGRYKRYGKRVLDLAIAGASLVVAAPVVAVIALAIKLDDGGPVLYRQERVGWHGRPFGMLKFRTMRIGAHDAAAALTAQSFRKGPLFKMREDPRVTRVGKLLRASNLDELPQLLNVLGGTMSVVGPRPALASEVQRFDERLLVRQTLRPGITGLWQVEAEENESFAVYRHLDVFYVENLTLGLDLSIIVATVVVIHAHLIGRVLRLGRKRTPPPPQPVVIAGAC